MGFALSHLPRTLTKNDDAAIASATKSHTLSEIGVKWVVL